MTEDVSEKARGTSRAPDRCQKKGHERGNGDHRGDAGDELPRRLIATDPAKREQPDRHRRPRENEPAYDQLPELTGLSDKGILGNFDALVAHLAIPWIIDLSPLDDVSSAVQDIR
jgi:hypothetical protein